MSYKVEKDWESNGLRCVVIMTEMGHRCGYVGVSKEHMLYGVSYNDKVESLKGKLEELKESDVGKRGIMSLIGWNGETVSPEILFNVHGGLTYSGDSKEYPVESDLWWFGYDCAHHGDAKDLTMVSETIRKIEMGFPTYGVLRTLDYWFTVSGFQLCW